MKTFKVIISGRQITFRELTLGEWGIVSDCMSGYFSLYLTSAQYGIVEPDISSLSVGEIIWIGEQVYLKSMKFSDEDRITSNVSSLVQNMDESVHVISALICRAFPAYKPEDVLTFDYETLVTRLAQISWMESQETQQGGNNPLQQRQRAAFNEADLREMSAQTSKAALSRELQRGGK